MGSCSLVHSLLICYEHRKYHSSTILHPRRSSSCSFPTSLGSAIYHSRVDFRPRRNFWTSLRMAEAGKVSSDGISRGVRIPNAQGQQLVGILDDTGSKQLCILCHGLRSSKRSGTLGVVASTLVRAGFSSYRFDFSGNGESEGEFSYGNYWVEVEDLRSVAQYWRSQGRDITAIIGHSKGDWNLFVANALKGKVDSIVSQVGDVVILYASRYGDVKTVVNMSGRFDLSDGYKERFGEEGLRKLEREGFLDTRDRMGEFRVTLKGLQERLATDIEGPAKNISKDCRVLTIHGSADEVIDVKDAYLFAKCIPNHVLKVVESANHNYEGYREQAAAHVLNFVQGNVSKL